LIARVLPAIALLIFAGACKPYDAARDETLKHNVTTIRKALASYRQETGQYPRSLNDLVPKYLRQIPVDPFTRSNTTWRATTEESVQPNADFQTGTVASSQSVIIDVHSAAPGADRSGTLYADY
jgi:general secretion pathway protein G